MSREGISYRFCDAIVRRPGRRFIAGLRLPVAAALVRYPELNPGQANPSS